MQPHLPVGGVIHRAGEQDVLARAQGQRVLPAEGSSQFSHVITVLISNSKAWHPKVSKGRSESPLVASAEAKPWFDDNTVVEQSQCVV